MRVKLASLVLAITLASLWSASAQQSPPDHPTCRRFETRIEAMRSSREGMLALLAETPSTCRNTRRAIEAATPPAAPPATAPPAPAAGTTPPRAAASRAAEEAAAWRIADRINTSAAYEAYLTDFPRGPNASEARARRDQLQEEEARFAQADAARTQIDPIYTPQGLQLAYAESFAAIRNLRLRLAYSSGQFTITNTSFRIDATDPENCLPDPGQPFWAAYSIRAIRNGQWAVLGASQAIELRRNSSDSYTAATVRVSGNLDRSELEDGQVYVWFFYNRDGERSGCGGGQKIQEGIGTGIR